MNDREIIHALLDTNCELTETQQEAFASMLDYLDSGENRTLSAKQREWITSVAAAKGVTTEESQNLYSAGLVPDGIKTRKTDGEKKAAATLANRPLRPPGRSA